MLLEVDRPLAPPCTVSAQPYSLACEFTSQESTQVGRGEPLGADTFELTHPLTSISVLASSKGVGVKLQTQGFLTLRQG